MGALFTGTAALIFVLNVSGNLGLTLWPLPPEPISLAKALVPSGRPQPYIALERT